MEKESRRQNFRSQVAEEISKVAEGEEGVVVVPNILEVVEVPVEVTIQVRIHVRNPAVTVGTPHL